MVLVSALLALAELLKVNLYLSDTPCPINQLTAQSLSTYSFEAVVKDSHACPSTHLIAHNVAIAHFPIEVEVYSARHCQAQVWPS